MDKSEVKSIIIVLLALLVILLGTCEVNQHIRKHNETNQPDTLAHSLYRQEKQKQIVAYEKTIARLQGQKDSLKSEVSEAKNTFLAVRPVVKRYQDRIKEQLSIPDSNCVDLHSLRVLTDSLFVNQDRADSACIETISRLEQSVANRDSILSVSNLVTQNLRDIQKEQDLKAQYLTDQLNIALKAQRKKARQNKILAGTLLILSGITTAVLVPQHLK